MKKIVLIAGLLSIPWARMAVADATVLPPDPPPAAQYETLWTKSPFAVATPDAVADSPDYALVGVMQLDGEAYASIVEKQNSDHFLIASDKEVKGMKLKSITHSTTGSDTFATVEKDGQVLTLKLESAPLGPPPGAPPGANGIPGMNVPTPTAQNIQMPGSQQNIPMPGANSDQAPLSPGAARFMRIHRPVIHLPPNPNANQAPPAAAQPTGSAPPSGDNGQPPQSVQPHLTPPSQ
jgi:hypothetical protein